MKVVEPVMVEVPFQKANWLAAPLPVTPDEVKYSRAVPPAFTLSCCKGEPNDVNPVPPLFTAIVVADHVPVVTVPSVVIEDCPT